MGLPFQCSRPIEMKLLALKRNKVYTADIFKIFKCSGFKIAYSCPLLSKLNLHFKFIFHLIAI